jgi:general secretion pathway protein L
MISAFLAWWLTQLSEFLPPWLRRPVIAGADGLVVAPIGPLDGVDAVAVRLRRSGREAPVGEFALEAGELKDLPLPRGLPILLKLPRREILEKRLVLPLAAQADLKQALGFEMDRETPFKPEELYWNHRVAKVDRHGRRLQVSLLLLPKFRLAPLLGALASAGITPKWVEIADGMEPDFNLPLDGGNGVPHDRSRHVLWPIAACCMLLALGAVVTPFVRQTIALAALDREVRIIQLRATRTEALRREIEHLSRSADLLKTELKNAGRPLEVLAAVTRILPDDTYLTELDVQERKLTLSGRSAGAARLIGALAADGHFRNPAFAAPVTRLEAIHAEVFTIIANLGSQP